MSGRNAGHREGRRVGWPNANPPVVTWVVKSADGEWRPSLASRNLSWVWGGGVVKEGGWEVSFPWNMGASPFCSFGVFSLASLALQVEALPSCHIPVPITYL